MTITDFADFLKGENLIFLLIVLAVFMSVLWAVIIIFFKVFKALARVFSRSEKKPEFNKNLGTKKESLPEEPEITPMPKINIAGGDFIKISPKTSDEKPEQKASIIPPKRDSSASAGLAKLKNENPETEAKPGRYKFFRNSDAEEQKNPAEGFSKSFNSVKGEESSRGGKPPKDQEKVAAEFNKNFGGLRGAEPSRDSPKIGVMPGEKNEAGVEKAGFFGNKTIEPKDSKDINKVQLSKKSEDASIFDGKDELTRRQLKYKLWKDPKVYKAARESLLFLKPTERAKLEKELFPTVYGSNISKSDVKTRMHKLSRKMLSEQNPQAKALLRKEIKFAKKITGVK